MLNLLQKSIVDDILTISKLDSNLLVITPVAYQPLTVAQRAVKMFDPELTAKDITVAFEEHHSLEKLNIDWVTLDPSRVLQILINLITNAIKFTAGRPQRKITIHVGASLSPPEMTYIPNFEYIPTKTPNVPEATGEDWGTGDLLYLRFKVQDTGCGLTVEEKQVLFQRFKQASPRTHAQYGGSGLGLFISRQLAELHGGKIGYASEAGVGSTFGFFIRVRRTDPSRNRSALSHQDIHVQDNALVQPVTPQRQDIASVSQAAGLLATKAIPKIDPKDLDILVVEDNEVNQKVLVKQLKKIGSAVAVANDGIEALEYLQTTHYYTKDGGKLSVILMDLEVGIFNTFTATITLC
jgi:hypothetical protein